MAIAALRAYLRELRTAKDMSQKDLSQAMGIGLRTFVTWELGGTDDLKSTPMVHAIRALDGSIDDAYQLLLSDTATVNDGIQLAHHRMLTPSLPAPIFEHTGPVAITALTSHAAHIEAALDAVTLPFSVRAGKRVYEGVRPGGRGQPPTVLVNGQPFRDVYRAAHGYDTGDLEWGYAGRGPQQLATALLTYECDLPDTWPFLSKPLPLAPDDALLLRSVRALQQYAALFVTTFPRDAQDIQWTLESRQFMLWVRLVISTVYATPNADPMAPLP